MINYPGGSVGNQCNAGAVQANLLNVVSLATGPDGSLYIGDFNLIRKVSQPDGEIFTVFQFEDTQRAFDYDLTLSPFDGKLYLSNAKKHQIWALKSLVRKDVKNPRKNWEIVVAINEAPKIGRSLAFVILSFFIFILR